MKRFVTPLVIVVGCGTALASDIPAPRAVSEVQRSRRDERFATRGQVDLFVASTAAIHFVPDDRRLWEPSTNLGVKAVTAALMGGDRKPRGGPTWFGDFHTYRDKMNPRFIRTDGAYTRPEKDAKGLLYTHHAVVQTAGVSAEGRLAGLVVSRGAVTAKYDISESLILATGDVTAAGVNCSVVICDGDVVLSQGASRSLIVARGKIEIKFGSDSSTLIAGGTVAAGKVPDIRYPPMPINPNADELRLWQLQVAAAEQFVVVTKERESNPLGLITFFELARIGLEVKVAEGVVQVSKVAAGSASEKAGLKVGDVILEAGGKKPVDAESLRRLLRDALAVGDATVKVQRGKDTLTLKVALPE